KQVLARGTRRLSRRKPLSGGARCRQAGPGTTALHSVGADSAQGGETRVKGARGIDRLLALQQRAELRAALAQRNDKVDLAAAERAFVKAARGYGERKGITYATWREAGVSPSVLAKARIARTST